jgi:hypothetical protein
MVPWSVHRRSWIKGKHHVDDKDKLCPKMNSGDIRARKSGLHARRDTRCDAPPDQEISSTLLNASSRNEKESQQTLAIRKLGRKDSVEKERGQRMSEAAKNRDRQKMNQNNAAKVLE